MVDVEGADWLEGVRFALTDFVLRQIREVDIPCWVREGRVAILCPETGDLNNAFARRLDAEWHGQVSSLKLAGLDRLNVVVNETIYPHDQRDWEATIDWLADRFDSTDSERRTG